MDENKYAKWTIDGDKKTECYFKFCDAHNQTLQKAIQAQIDELDMTLIVEEDN